MRKLIDEEKIGMFESQSDGEISLIYGRIGQGKTTHAVRLMLQALENGRAVYSNIKLDLSTIEFDDRKSLWRSFVYFVTFQKRYFVFPKENFHYFNPDNFEPEEMVEYLANLTDCDIFYDEGHWLLDSYQGTKISKSRRKLVLEGRHFGRCLYLITQRPTAIAVSARGNVNRFYKCQKLVSSPFLVLMVQEFQDMENETVKETEPVSVQRYIAHSGLHKVFNTFYLRGGVQRSQSVLFDVYLLSFKERGVLLYKNILNAFSFLKKRKGEEKNIQLAGGVSIKRASIKNIERAQDGSMSVSKPVIEQQGLPF